MTSLSMPMEKEPDADLFSLSELHQKSHAAVAYWLEQAEGLTKTDLGAWQPQLLFDLKGLSAGMVVVSRARNLPPKIRLNEDLLCRYPAEMLSHTVPHEVAHLVTYVMFGKLDHGPEWRTVMTYFGKPADRCHQMRARPARRQRRHRYQCLCKEHQVGPQINARIKRGQRYACRECGTSLKDMKQSYFPEP